MRFSALSSRPAPSPLPFNERFAGFAYALSHSLFVGRGACPSRCAKPFHPHNPLKSASIPRPTPTLPKTALSLALHYHSCLPCQREVDRRHDTNSCFVAFCLRYAHPFYIANFSAVKTEGLPHRTFRPALPLLAPLSKGSWIATRLLLIINCLALRFKPL